MTQGLAASVLYKDFQRHYGEAVAKHQYLTGHGSGSSLPVSREYRIAFADAVNAAWLTAYTALATCDTREKAADIQSKLHETTRMCIAANVPLALCLSNSVDYAEKFVRSIHALVVMPRPSEQEIR